MPYVVQMYKVEPNQTPELLTTAEVARLLGKDVATVNRRVVAGHLHATAKAPGIRGARLFDRREVEAYVASLDAP